MRKIDLIKVEHVVKVGDRCGPIEPNITEDTIFLERGKVIGFYIKNMEDHHVSISKIADVANAEFLSDRVPKSTMKRSSGLFDKSKEVLQYSTILGYVPPKPHMRRAYATMSSVHNVPSANIFIKAMLQLCQAGEEIVKKIAPEIFEEQFSIIQKNVPEKWRFGRLFTSSISNFNISAPFHRDTGNLEGCVNIIIAKKFRANGGNTTVPDYAATVDSSENSMLVYPAWRNVHGVTPIEITGRGGYRNSLVFYPLKIR